MRKFVRKSAREGRVSLRGRILLDKTYVDAVSWPSKPEGKEFSTRRVFHGQERRYLSPEAQLMAYGLLNSQSVPLDVTENAIQQAVTLGSASGTEIDAQTFEALFYAVTLNPAFELASAFASSMTHFGSWVC